MREGRSAAPAVLLGVLVLAVANAATALPLEGRPTLPTQVVPEAELLHEVPAETAEKVLPNEDLPEPRLPKDVPDLPRPRPLGPLLQAAQGQLEPVARQVGLVEERWSSAALEPEPHDLQAYGKEHEAPLAALRLGKTPGFVESAAAVSALALLGGALAYFWPLLKYAVAPLYSRIAKDHVLVHGSREAIYRLVKENPGIHAHQVAERLDLAWGTTVHHLKLLEQNALLVAHRDGRYKRFFVAGEPALAHKEAVALLRNDTSRRIAETVAERPGLIQKQVCEALGMSSSLATWHLQRLAEAGLVLAHRRGRVVHYEPGPAWPAVKDLGASG